MTPKQQADAAMKELLVTAESEANACNDTTAGFLLNVHVSIKSYITQLEQRVADLTEALTEILPWHDSHPLEPVDNPVINKCRAALAQQKPTTTGEK